MASNMATFEELKKLTEDKNETIVDVREPRELEESGVIPSSINIPLGTIENTFNMSSEDFNEKFGRPKPNLNDSITVSCKMGGRSAKAQILLRGLGYTNVKNYSGGWMEWEKNYTQ